MTDEGMLVLGVERSDGIYLGAVGTPDVPDDVTLWGLLIPIRREFDQYINRRPMRLLPGERVMAGSDWVYGWRPEEG